MAHGRKQAKTRKGASEKVAAPASMRQKWSQMQGCKTKEMRQECMDRGIRHRDHVGVHHESFVLKAWSLQSKYTENSLTPSTEEHLPLTGHCSHTPSWGRAALVGTAVPEAKPPLTRGKR